jgi:hypothetical protein
MCRKVMPKFSMKTTDGCMILINYISCRACDNGHQDDGKLHDEKDGFVVDDADEDEEQEQEEARAGGEQMREK